MGTKELKFLEKNGIAISDIMYITREGRKAVIHLKNGRTVETFNTLKGLLESLPATKFECVNKGVVISKEYVDSVEDNTYFMKDGVSFKGRVRTAKKEKTKKVESANMPAQVDDFHEFAILDKLPLPFCVIELKFDETSHGVDFIFRYCNKQMEDLEGKTIDEMLNHSFYDVFKNGDKKWLVAYADVALYGIERVIESYSPEIDENLRIYCFQPKPNYCACLLMKV